ncbi:MAG: hypothetical protein QM599_10930 [Pseudoxanthomonas sp.]
MRNSPGLCNASASWLPAIEAPMCRLDWRPSRWLLAALAVIALLAAFSVLASEMPRIAAWPLALAALGYGAWLIRREAMQPVRCMVFPGNASPVLLDGQPLDDVRVHWRGPLAFVQWWQADGRAGRLSFWPDTLPPAPRRELRLAAGAGDTTRDRRVMAP